jgi:voltage-gated potassium channel
MAHKGDLPTLQRRALQDWHGLTLRILIALGLIALAFSILWIDRGGLRDNTDGHLSFADVIYFTMITVTTVGYGDIIPVTERARLIDAFLITPIRVFLWLIFLGTAFEFLVKRSWENWRMRKIQQTLCDHVVLAGFGHSGQKAMDELIAGGMEVGKIVIVDCDADAVEVAKQAGAAVIRGDATRDEVLSAVHIERATSLIVSCGRDDTSVLVVLTARHLAPKLRIAVAVRNVDNEDLARQAGANVVINPVSFTGLLLASSSQGEHLADYLHDLVTTEGQVVLREREAKPEEFGRSLKDVCDGLAVRLYRGGLVHAPWDKSTRIKAGDMILEVVPTPSTS